MRPPTRDHRRWGIPRRSDVLETDVSKHRMVAVLAVAVFVGLWPATADATQAAPATVAAGRHGPGRPVAVEPLPAALWLPGTATAYRIRYSSTGFAGRPAVVSGAAFVPAG